MTSLKVNVSSRHIKASRAGQQSIIALALKEFDPHIRYVRAQPDMITIRKDNKNGTVQQRWNMPLKASRQLVLFESGEVIKPFKFAARFLDEKVTKMPAKVIKKSPSNRRATSRK